MMRTAIMSAQSFADVKKFLLTDVVPALCSKSVWASSSDLWKGVIYVANKFAVAGYKHSESTLRALLGVPGPQLRQVLKQAEGVKPQMAKLLGALSSEEKEEVRLRSARVSPIRCVQFMCINVILIYIFSCCRCCLANGSACRHQPRRMLRNSSA